MTTATATLRAAPYEDGTGQWKAAATIQGQYASILCRAEHADRRQRDTIIVIKNQDGQWSAK